MSETILASLERNINSVLLGKADVVRRAVVCLLCRGHLLLEDVPGTGKTVLAKTMARSIHARFSRIQFTPDLLPSDVTGGNIYNQKSGQFDFIPGPVFTNILLGDEINRATPRTQSALLEAMEEKQVTVDGVTHRLPELFHVIATQNPIEQQGTFPLPEAQLDRFFMRLSVGYPPADAELSVMDLQPDHHPVDSVPPVLAPDALAALQASVETVFVHPSIKNYILSIVRLTREHDALTLGVSPRGTMSLRRAAQAHALAEGRAFVVPDDVKRLAPNVLTHRMILKPQARVGGRTESDVLSEILQQVAVPVEYEPAG